MIFASVLGTIYDLCICSWYHIWLVHLLLVTYMICASVLGYIMAYMIVASVFGTIYDLYICYWYHI